MPEQLELASDLALWRRRLRAPARSKGIRSPKRMCAPRPGRNLQHGLARPFAVGQREPLVAECMADAATGWSSAVPMQAVPVLPAAPTPAGRPGLGGCASQAPALPARPIVGGCRPERVLRDRNGSSQNCDLMSNGQKSTTTLLRPTATLKSGSDVGSAPTEIDEPTVHHPRRDRAVLSVDFGAERRRGCRTGRAVPGWTTGQSR